MSVFERKGNRFLLDGKDFLIFSGTMHYFRIHPELWEDRLDKFKALGLNTLETYVPWNLHEPYPGKFNFSGFADVERYIKAVAERNLKILIRPVPYMCAEWDFGALPWWLLNIPGMRIRSNNKPFLEALSRYYDHVLPILNRYSCLNGGPIIAVQIENEYGAYGNDKNYLARISKMLQKGLPGIMQFTSDNPFPHWLPAGIYKDTPCLLNFGSRAAEARKVLADIAPDMPFVCAEYWLGWFDHWGEEHHLRDAEDVAQVMHDILTDHGHVNLYPFHGGTTFGFMNGANCPSPKEYQPIVNSYDFDAPLSENGAPTPKYAALRRVFAEFGSGIDPQSPLPAAPETCAYGEVPLTETALLFDNLDNLATPVESPYPVTMEELNQGYGFILYRISLPRVSSDEDITLDEPRDRAQVFLNREYCGTVYCNDESYGIRVDFKPGDELDVFVENMGRCNYGSWMQRTSRKGITDFVRIGSQALCNYRIWGLPLDDLSKLNFSGEAVLKETPAFYRGFFEADKIADTFIKVSGQKGVVFINGFNLGRYWEIGPQQTLYIPAPLLKKGKNEIIVFELHKLQKASVELLSEPIL